jgi:peptidoglycan hydrolase-like protein with peptidoglycan-binding domain
MSIHHTRPGDTSVVGWAHLRPGWEVTVLPVVDTRYVLDDGGHVFARMNYDEALEVAAREGAQLPTGEDVEALRRIGVQLAPYFGTPTAENELHHSKLHDADVARQLVELDWCGEHPVFNAGKHWIHDAPAGKSRLFGWWLNGKWVQPNHAAHNRLHFDDGTTTILVRRCDHHTETPPPDTESDPYADTDPPPDSADSMPRITKPGERGADVAAWQVWLMAHGYDLPRFGSDGDHGSETERATMRYRQAQTTLAAGDPVPGMPHLYPFRQAKHYRKGRGKGDPIWIVIHTSENDPSHDGAKALQAYAASMGDGRTASWHCAVSAGGVAECVDTGDVAFAAPGANARGIQVELFTRTAKATWRDTYHAAMLEQAAAWCARECERWDIPVEKVGPTEMRAGQPGFCGHIDVTRGVGKGRTSHRDPGPGFPWQSFLASVRRYMA